MLRVYLVIGVLFYGALSTSTAVAEAPGKFRIALDMDLFRFTAGWAEEKAPPHPHTDYRHVTGGIGLPTWGIILAGAVTPSIVLGARVYACATSENMYGDDVAFRYGGDFLFEYIFLRHVVRPFFMFQAGVQGWANHPGGDPPHNDWWIAFGGDGGGGLHLVATPSLSFDFTALAGVRGGPGGHANGAEYTHFRFSTGVMFGISGWLR
ncbi:MAG: hypothetical protein MUC50_07555 [Myxococcota bacterium]|jgi:hypothetical protein|nr:hypothetical protein [Myxococcota bacterium]